MAMTTFSEVSGLECENKKHKASVTHMKICFILKIYVFNL